jgi:hypothetical protein
LGGGHNNDICRGVSPTCGGGTRKEALKGTENPPTLKFISSTNTTSINNLITAMQNLLPIKQYAV